MSDSAQPATAARPAALDVWQNVLTHLSMTASYGASSEEMQAAKRLRDALQKRTPEILRECAS